MYIKRKWRNGVRNWRGEIKETCRERRIKIRKKAEAERKRFSGRKMKRRRQKYLQEEKKTEAERKEPWEGDSKL
jgi:hypothetical protein